MTMLSPTAGYIHDVSRGSQPGPLSDAERSLLGDLARKVAGIAAEPGQEEKRQLWYRHNRLESTRPLFLVFPEDSWEEVLGEDGLAVADPYWRQWEWYLRHLIYRTDRIDDDFVVEPSLHVPVVLRTSGGRGLHGRTIGPGVSKGAWRYDPPLTDPADISKLRHVTIEVDEPATQMTLQAVRELFGGILPVVLSCPLPHANLVGEASMLRGIDQLMLDLYDRPSWVHELMSFLADEMMTHVNYLEESGYLTLNNRNHYTDSGGIGYSTELPSAGHDANHAEGVNCGARLCDLWGFGVAQEWALVSPEQHAEFLLAYQRRLLDQCGLVAYGCCEPYTTKFDMLKQIPRLRRVSVSPWCDLPRAVGALGSDFVLSWKPNPALLVGNFDAAWVRTYIRDALNVSRGCIFEMILKDTFTVNRHPERFTTWADIAREEIERVGAE